MDQIICHRSFYSICNVRAQFSVRTAVMQQPAFSPKGLAFFAQKIRPVLADNCYQCHSAKAKKPAGELLLYSRAVMLKGGAQGNQLKKSNS